MKLRTKCFDRVLNLAGILAGFGASVILAVTFYAAYFNGYQVLITVNDFNEAHIEALVVIPIYVILTTYSVVYTTRRLKHE